jgi:hypothetical protein
MARQSKHIRLQVAHKAAQMMAEEGISDYAFAKRKAAKFFGLMDGDALPSNNEIKDAIKEHQAIFFDTEQKDQLKRLRLEALLIMKNLSAFDPSITGSVLDGTAGRYPKIELLFCIDSMKEIEYYLLNKKISYEIKDKKIINHKNKDREIAPILFFESNNIFVEFGFLPKSYIETNMSHVSAKKLELLINKMDFK